MFEVPGISATDLRISNNTSVRCGQMGLKNLSFAICTRCASLSSSSLSCDLTLYACRPVMIVVVVPNRFSVRFFAFFVTALSVLGRWVVTSNERRGRNSLMGQSAWFHQHVIPHCPMGAKIIVAATIIVVVHDHYHHHHQPHRHHRD